MMFMHLGGVLSLCFRHPSSDDVVLMVVCGMSGAAPSTWGEWRRGRARRPATKEPCRAQDLQKKRPVRLAGVQVVAILTMKEAILEPGQVGDQ